MITTSRAPINLKLILSALIISLLMALPIAQAREDFYKPALGNLDPALDGQERAITTTEGEVIAFDYQGNLLPDFPLSFTDQVVASAPVIADVTGDSADELIFLTRNQAQTYTLRAYNSQGTELDSTSLPEGVYYDPQILQEVGNNKKSILIATTAGSVNSYRMVDGSFTSRQIADLDTPIGAMAIRAGFRVIINFPQENRLVVYNYFDSDDTWRPAGDEVPLSSPIIYPVMEGADLTVYGINADDQLVGLHRGNGTLEPGFPVQLPLPAIDSPLLTDVIPSNAGPELTVTLINGQKQVYSLAGELLEAKLTPPQLGNPTLPIADLAQQSIWTTSHLGGIALSNGLSNPYDTFYSDIWQLIAVKLPIDGATINVPEKGYFTAGIWADYNNNGTPDVLLPNWQVPASVYSLSGTSFNSSTLEPISSTPMESFGAAWADYNNDGWTDLIIAGYGQQNRLYRNDGTGSFVEITGQQLVTEVTSTISVSWADYNSDGLLDIYLSNENRNQLYRNDGNDQFTEITDLAIVTGDYYSYGGLWGDVDNDGDQDLLVINYNQANQLFINNDGNFTQQSGTPFSAIIDDSYDAAFGDYNNDGFIDIAVANYGGANRLYRNLGTGQFTEVTNTPIIAGSAESISITWGDLENDGDLDLFVANFTELNQLYINNGDGSFSEETQHEYVAENIQAVTAGWQDINQNGANDLFVTGGFDVSTLFLDAANEGNWVGINLESQLSNRSIYGARIQLTAGEQTFSRQLTGAFNAKTQGLSATLIGLGSVGTLDSAEIFWPSGTRQDILGDLTINSYNTVTEIPPQDPTIAIAIDDTPQSNAGSFNFPQTFANTTTQVTVSISNNGVDDLVLPASPVSISGNNAANFNVPSQPSPLTIATGESVDITLEFTPTNIATYRANLSIANNDPSASPFTLSLVGEGTATTITSSTVSQTSVNADGEDQITFTVVAATEQSENIDYARFNCNHRWYSSNPNMCLIEWDQANGFREYVATSYGNQYIEIIDSSYDDSSVPNQVTFSFTLTYSGIEETLTDNILATYIKETTGYATNWKVAPESSRYDIIADSATQFASLESTTVDTSSVSVSNPDNNVVTISVNFNAPNPDNLSDVRLYINHPWYAEGRPGYGFVQYLNGSFREYGSYANNALLELLTGAGESERIVNGDTVTFNFKIRYDQLPEGYTETGLIGNTIGIYFRETDPGGEVINASNWSKQEPAIDVLP